MMRHLSKSAAPHRARHLVFGSGGTRAFLNGAGATFACNLAGISNWQSIGGVSGGSIPALLVAAGVPPHEIVRHAVATDFTELLKQTDTFQNMVRRRLFRRGPQRLRHGIVNSEGLGSHLERHVQVWPEKFWTMAVAGRRQYVFTADGVFVYRRGKCHRISDKPAPIGLAIRASCAVPGIIEAIEFMGHVLFDGALSRYGACPTEMAKHHFGAEIDDIIAVDLVRRAGTRRDRFIEMIARTLSGTLRQKPSSTPFVPEAGVVIRTQMETFNSLDFTISTERKQSAVLAGFRETCKQLWSSGQLSDIRMASLLSRSEQWEQFEQLLDEGVAPSEQPTLVEDDARPPRRKWYYLWLR